MIVWFTPSRIAGRASGSWTFRSTWLFVAPNDTAASTRSAGTSRIPRSVRRMHGGRA